MPVPRCGPGEGSNVIGWMAAVRIELIEISLTYCFPLIARICQ